MNEAKTHSLRMAKATAEDIDAAMDAIQRCREAIYAHDDMLSVASRFDFGVLLAAYDRAVAERLKERADG